MPLLFGLLFQVSGNFLFSHILAVFSIEVDRFHCHEVDNTFKLIFLSDWNLHWNSIDFEFVTKLLYNSVKVRTCPVHLVDERQSRNLVAFHLSVNSHRLTLNTTNRTQDKNSTIKNSQASFNFNGKVHVAWSINQIDRMTIPFNARCS